MHRERIGRAGFARRHDAGDCLPSSARLELSTADCSGAMRAGLPEAKKGGPFIWPILWGRVLPVVNLRLDWSGADPIAHLERLWSFNEPQLEACVMRTIEAAPLMWCTT